MPTTPFAFAGGAAPGLAFGRNQKVRFVGTWADGDTWTLEVTSTLSGDFTLGKGNIAGAVLSAPFKLKGRIYLASGEDFAFSANDDVTLWEEQNAGAGSISFTSQFGAQDTPTAFASLQGRLAVFGKLSIQMWQYDADPANFALIQVLDNAGTLAPLSVKSIGDLDVLYLDYSGVRSLRAKESTLNAFVSDVGTPIDSLLQAAGPISTACAIVEPLTKQYWLYLNGNIYVLAQYPQSKIVAWSTYKPTYEVIHAPTISTYSALGESTYTGLTVGKIYYWEKGANDLTFTSGSTSLSASGSFVATSTTAAGTGTPTATNTSILTLINTDFVPIKFVVRAGQVFVRDTNGNVYSYGGEDGDIYDRTVTTVELPWLDMGETTRVKQGQAIDVAMKGEWAISAGMNPRGSLLEVVNRGDTGTPSMLTDSTFDIGRFPFSSNGTHFKLKAVSAVEQGPVKLGKLALIYNLLHTK